MSCIVVSICMSGPNFKFCTCCFWFLWKPSLFSPSCQTEDPCEMKVKFSFPFDRPFVLKLSVILCCLFSIHLSLSSFYLLLFSHWSFVLFFFTGTFGGFGTTTTAAAPGSTFSFTTPSNTTGQPCSCVQTLWWNNRKLPQDVSPTLPVLTYSYRDPAAQFPNMWTCPAHSSINVVITFSDCVSTFFCLRRPVWQHTEQRVWVFLWTWHWDHDWDNRIWNWIRNDWPGWVWWL